MNRVKILAVASLASVAFAGGDLWDFGENGTALLSDDNCGKFCGQVHTPGAIYCWQDIGATNAANEYGGACFHGTGGFWFGYKDNGGEVTDAVTSSNDLAKCEGVVIEKYIEPNKQNVDWISKTVVGSVSKAGHYMIKGYGLGAGTEGFDVKFVNAPGTLMDPSVSAIAFNWRGKEEPSCNPASASEKYPNKDYQDIYTEDLSSKQGLCVVYKADKGDAEVGVDVELGWDEVNYQYNTWGVRLPAASNWKTLNMKWEHFAPAYESPEDFIPLNTALTEADALKLAFKNKTNNSVTIRFQLKELGWYGTCSGTASEPDLPNKWWEEGGGPDPIIGGKMASSYKFNLKGRMLSANFAGIVQVVNLQGKIVAQKALAKGEYLNLANVPMGVYMVRSEKNGIVQKIMVK